MIFSRISSGRERNGERFVLAVGMALSFIWISRLRSSFMVRQCLRESSQEKESHEICHVGFGISIAVMRIRMRCGEPGCEIR